MEKELSRSCLVIFSICSAMEERVGSFCLPAMRLSCACIVTSSLTAFTRSSILSAATRMLAILFSCALAAPAEADLVVVAVFGCSGAVVAPA